MDYGLEVIKSLVDQDSFCQQALTAEISKSEGIACLC